MSNIFHLQSNAKNIFHYKYIDLNILGKYLFFSFFCRATLKTIALKIFTSNAFIQILCPNVLLYAESATLNAFIPKYGLESKCMFSIGNNQYQAFPSWWLFIYVILSLVSRDFSFDCIYSNNQFHLILIAFVITLLLKYTLIFSFLSYILLRVNCVSGQIISK